MSMESATVFGSGTLTSRRATPLLAVSEFVETVGFHLPTLVTDGSTLGRKTHPIVKIDVFLATLI
ncbi:MAG: hypothetical protein WD469_04115 [Paenibacillaceae bacterium]